MKEFKIGDKTISLPIVQGGMGIGVSMSSLASSVSKEGGIGTISGVQAGFLEPDFIKNPIEANLRAISREITKAKQITKNMIALNLMSAMKNYDTYVKEAVKNKVDIIVSGAGLPLTLPTLVKGSDTKIIPIVSSARALNLITKSWLKQGKLPDAVVLEGPLAGGHLGFKLDEMQNKAYKSLEELIIEVRSAIFDLEQKYNVKIPLIAGGGIHTKEDVDRILDCGADAVQIGTRFIATNECDAHENFKNTFIKAKEQDVKIIKSPVGMPARALNNNFLELAYTKGIPVENCFSCMSYCKPKEIPFCISKQLFNSVTGNEGLVFSGANGYKINEITSVHSLISSLT